MKWLCICSSVYFKDEEQPFPFFSSPAAVFKGTSTSACEGMTKEKGWMEAQLDRPMHIHATTAHTGPAGTHAFTPLIMAILISAQDFSWFFLLLSSLNCFLKISSNT